MIMADNADLPIPDGGWGAVLRSLYGRLHRRFGPQRWWPGDSAWEVCAGAVLTQNTNWGNVEKAIAAMRAAGMMSPAAVAAAPRGDLEAAIRPSGYFRLKAARLLAVAEWWREEVDGDGGGAVAVFKDPLGRWSAGGPAYWRSKGSGRRPPTASSFTPWINPRLWLMPILFAS
jgi:hypothetical protein